jgi:hypothetical protein
VLWIFRLIGLALVLAAGLETVAAAQSAEPSTRAEALRQQREEKQQALTPNRPSAVQRAMEYAEDRSMFLLARDGFYPKIGTLTTGSGFALGMGYRNRDRLDRRGVIELWGAASIKKYWATQVRVAFPDLAAGRVMAEASGNLRDYPSERFYGLGPNSSRQEQIFPLRLREVGGRGGVRIFPKLLVGAGGFMFAPRTERAEVHYLRSNAFVEVDYREPLNARKGGWYRVDYSNHHDQDDGVFSFHRTDVDLRQYIGFLAGRRVIALRAWMASTRAAVEGNIPFYLMPTLGGNDSLRGFNNYRFRAPHAMLMQAEYRWEIWSGLDAALFYDTGKVALRRRDLNFEHLESDYGFGFRFNTSQGVVLRVDTAFGSGEGTRLHIVFGGVF